MRNGNEAENTGDTAIMLLINSATNSLWQKIDVIDMQLIDFSIGARYWMSC